MLYLYHLLLQNNWTLVLFMLTNKWCFYSVHVQKLHNERYPFNGCAHHSMSHGCGIVSRDAINVRLGCVLFWVVKKVPSGNVGILSIFVSLFDGLFDINL